MRTRQRLNIHATHLFVCFFKLTWKRACLCTKYIPTPILLSAVPCNSCACSAGSHAPGCLCRYSILANLLKSLLTAPNTFLNHALKGCQHLTSHTPSQSSSASRMALLETSKYPQGSVLGGMNPDLASERQTASFSVEKLTAWLDGGAEHTRIRRAVGE